MDSKELPEPTMQLQTIEGKERVERNIRVHEEHVAKRKDEYDNFVAHKR